MSTAQEGGTGGAPIECARTRRLDGPPARRFRRARAGFGGTLLLAGLVAGSGGLSALAAGRPYDGSRQATVVTPALAPAGLRVRTPGGPTAGTPTPPGAGRSITIPDSVDGYRRETGGIADRIAENLRKSMATAQNQYGTAYNKAKIAIYARPGESGRPLVFVGLPGKDIPQLAAELRSRPPSEEVDSVFMGMGVMNAKDYPGGPLGGVLRCGKGPTDGQQMAAACVWSDSSVIGLTMTPLSDDIPALARITLALRGAAEH